MAYQIASEGVSKIFTITNTETGIKVPYKGSSIVFGKNESGNLVIFEQITTRDKIEIEESGIYGIAPADVLDSTGAAIGDIDDILAWGNDNVGFNTPSGGSGGTANFANITGQPRSNPALASEFDKYLKNDASGILNGTLTVTGDLTVSGDVVAESFVGDGSQLTGLPSGAALGETSTTAYRGDRGKTAYDHTLLTSNPHSVTKTQVGLSNVDDTSDISKPISTATQTALNLKANLSGATFTNPIVVPDATLSTQAVNKGQLDAIVPGLDGKSAYDIAVDNGFDGTEEEWLESLQGTTDISPKWVEVTADRDLLPTDIGKILYNTGPTDVTITIPDDTTLGISEDVSFTAWHEGAGKVRFKSGSGVTANPIQTVGTTLIEPLSYMRRGANNWLGVKGEVWYSDTLLDPSLVSLYKANSLVGTDGTSVSSWNDQKGTNNAEQATAGYQPKLNIVSGKKEVTFDGIDDNLVIGTPSNLDFTPGTDEFTIVIKFGSNAGTAGSFLGKATTATANRMFNAYWSTPTVMIVHIGGIAIPAFSPLRTGNDLMIITVSTTVANIWWNGSQIVIDEPIGTAVNSEGWVMGARSTSSPSNYFNGTFKDVAIYNSVLGLGKILDIISEYTE